MKTWQTWPHPSAGVCDCWVYHPETGRAGYTDDSQGGIAVVCFEDGAFGEPIPWADLRLIADGERPTLEQWAKSEAESDAGPFAKPIS